MFCTFFFQVLRCRWRPGAREWKGLAPRTRQGPHTTTATAGLGVVNPPDGWRWGAAWARRRRGAGLGRHRRLPRRERSRGAAGEGSFMRSPRHHRPLPSPAAPSIPTYRAGAAPNGSRPKSHSPPRIHPSPPAAVAGFSVAAAVVVGPLPLAAATTAAAGGGAPPPSSAVTAPPPPVAPPTVPASTSTVARRGRQGGRTGAAAVQRFFPNKFFKQD